MSHWWNRLENLKNGKHHGFPVRITWNQSIEHHIWCLNSDFWGWKSSFPIILHGQILFSMPFQGSATSSCSYRGWNTLGPLGEEVVVASKSLGIATEKPMRYLLSWLYYDISSDIYICIYIYLVYLYNPHYSHLYIYIYPHTYVRTYVHTYIHTHIYIYTYHQLTYISHIIHHLK